MATTPNESIDMKLEVVVIGVSDVSTRQIKLPRLSPLP
jgi:hypothetical protein